MLGSTAGGLLWMFRYLERSENTARLIEAGLRIALSRSADASTEWKSVVATVGALDEYNERHPNFDSASVVDFLLRDASHSHSVASVIESARSNARLVRTQLTREVWEATNQCWMSLSELLALPTSPNDLPRVLGQVRQESAYVRGALHGTMMRNDAYDFCRLGTFLERADNTARILDVKYYVLLPSAMHVGSGLDNVQWENILRSVSAQRGYRWRNPGRINPKDVAEFLILDPRLPRSLAFCFAKISANLGYLAAEYDERLASHAMAERLEASVTNRSIESVFDLGLHEFLQQSISCTQTLANQIELDYRFSV